MTRNAATTSGQEKPAAEQLKLRRARLSRPDLFQRFRVLERGEPLPNLRLADDTELIVFERRGERRALLLRQMAYHLLRKAVWPASPISSASDHPVTAGSV